MRSGLRPCLFLGVTTIANIAHSVLAGTEIHEPKGVTDASLGQVYVADGNGSGNWANIGTSSFTGMIADFAWPQVQEGWLECDGSDINITTYGTLFAVMTIQGNGTRTNGSAVVTSLSSTTPMRVGYYIYGTGIPEDTTIISVDSASQVTMSANASSTGTANVIVSPWRLGNGVIRLPNLSAAGRYRRARTSTSRVGELQDSQNLSHTHSISGNTGTQSSNHAHTYSGNTGTESATHTHPYEKVTAGSVANASAGPYYTIGSISTVNTASESAFHTHGFSGTTSGENASHYHSVSLTSASTGSSEARPLSMVVMTCVKT